jgi:hypothetical protein
VLGALLVIAVAAACAWAASYLMWRACSRSGLWGLVAGAVFAILALGCAVLIALVITRSWFRTPG